MSHPLPSTIVSLARVALLSPDRFFSKLLLIVLFGWTAILPGRSQAVGGLSAAPLSRLVSYLSDGYWRGPECGQRNSYFPRAGQPE